MKLFSGYNLTALYFQGIGRDRKQGGFSGEEVSGDFVN